MRWNLRASELIRALQELPGDPEVGWDLTKGSGILTEGEVDQISRRERGIPQAHEMARVLDSHELLRDELKHARSCLDRTCKRCSSKDKEE